MADRVKAACVKNFAAHHDNCSGFVSAVAADLGVTLTGTANDITNTLRAGGAWVRLGSGPEASAAAQAGKLVIAGLRGDEQTHPDPHGHVVVVVEGGPLAHGLYPPAFWGKLNSSGAQNETLNFAWNPQDRDRISYAAHDLA